jgi:hypothetical protein
MSAQGSERRPILWLGVGQAAMALAIVCLVALQLAFMGSEWLMHVSMWWFFIGLFGFRMIGQQRRGRGVGARTLWSQVAGLLAFLALAVYQTITGEAVPHVF